MDVTIVAYVNERTERRFMEYEAGDPLMEVDRFRFSVDGTLHPSRRVWDALDLMWEVGNRMARDEDGRDWPRAVRSLSVGDVLHATTPDGVDQWAAVAGIGWDDIEEPTSVGQGGLDGRAAQPAHPASAAGPLARGGVVAGPGPEGAAYREAVVARKRIWEDTVATAEAVR